MKIYTVLLILMFTSHLAFADAKHTPDASKGFEAMTVEEQTEFDQLVDGIIEDVCGYDMQIGKAQGAIERQKEIQKLTGTIDLTAMNNAGAVIVDLTKERNKKVTVYQNTMGKDLKGYTCDY